MQDEIEMTDSEVIEQMLLVVDKLFETTMMHGKSIENFDARLSEIRDVLSVHETCISELQEAIIELRHAFDLVRDVREDGRSISAGGIIL